MRQYLGSTNALYIGADSQDDWSALRFSAPHPPDVIYVVYYFDDHYMNSEYPPWAELCRYPSSQYGVLRKYYRFPFYAVGLPTQKEEKKKWAGAVVEPIQGPYIVPE